jgi:hypothetical protein
MGDALEKLSRFALELKAAGLPLPEPSADGSNGWPLKRAFRETATLHLPLPFQRDQHAIYGDVTLATPFSTGSACHLRRRSIRRSLFNGISTTHYGGVTLTATLSSRRKNPDSSLEKANRDFCIDYNSISFLR